MKRHKFIYENKWVNEVKEIQSQNDQSKGIFANALLNFRSLISIENYFLPNFGKM
jgi:hypothetical protein